MFGEMVIGSKNRRLYARYLIGEARHLMYMARQKELVPCHISPRQGGILDVLSNIGHKATLAELAKYTGRKMSSLSVQMTRMENDGLVKKTKETLKSNLVSFELTVKGSDIYNYSKDMKSDKIIMSVLSDEECEQLISMLKKLINKAGKYV